MSLFKIAVVGACLLCFAPFAAKAESTEPEPKTIAQLRDLYIEPRRVAPDEIQKMVRQESAFFADLNQDRENPSRLMDAAEKTSVAGLADIVAPRSVAVVGASEDLGKFGGRVLHHLAVETDDRTGLATRIGAVRLGGRLEETQAAFWTAP